MRRDFGVAVMRSQVMARWVSQQKRGSSTYLGELLLLGRHFFRVGYRSIQYGLDSLLGISAVSGDLHPARIPWYAKDVSPPSCAKCRC